MAGLTAPDTASMAPALAVAGPAAAAREKVIEVDCVSKWYVRGDSRTRVLENCSLTVHRGECVFLMGPSGSGKTTLLSIIGGVLQPDVGCVRLMGRPLESLDAAEAARLRRTSLGFVFQRFHLIRGLTALENVCVPLTVSGVPREEAQQRGRELLQMVGLADKADSQHRQLSVGECQRVALARALAADPPLILADEPTASLDAATGRQAMRLLRDLTVSAKKTVIVVTHDPRIQSFADTIFQMENGRLSQGRKPGSRVSPGGTSRAPATGIAGKSPGTPHPLPGRSEAEARCSPELGKKLPEAGQAES